MPRGVGTAAFGRLSQAQLTLGNCIMLAGSTDQIGDGVIHVIDTSDKASRLCTWLLRHRPLCGLDCETVGINPKKQAGSCGSGRIVCWSISFANASGHTHSRYPWLLLGNRVFLWTDALALMRPWLEQPACPKVLHNGSTFDVHMFANHGIHLRGFLADTLRMSKLRNPSSEVRHDLKSLMWWRLGYKLGGYRELFSRPGKLASTTVEVEKRTRKKVGESLRVPTLVAAGEHARVSWAQSKRELIPLDELAHDYPGLLPMLFDYATLDAKATLELYHLLLRELEEMEWTWGR